MNTPAKIGLGIGIPVALILIVLVLNVFAINNLQFRAHSVESFDIVDMSADAKFEVCNPTFFPASFNTLEIDMIYKSTDFGTFTVWGKTIPSQSPTVVDGRLNINGQAVFQLFVAAMGSAFGGQEMDFDPEQIRFITTLDAPILGVIPFSVSQNYSADEFQKIIQGDNDAWSCGGNSKDSFLDDIPFISDMQNNADSKDMSEPTVIESQFENIPAGPSGTGNLGDEHEHAALLVMIFGDQFDFSLPVYQIKTSWIHFEGGDGNTIHRHASGVTLEYLFQSLKLGLDDKCFVFQDGREFCTNEDYSLKFYINDKQVSEIGYYVIEDEDRILISYGGETLTEIQEQLLELNNLEIIE